MVDNVTSHVNDTGETREQAIINLFNYIVYSLIILIGVPGNVLLVWCLVSVRREQVNKSYKVLVISLAVDDILLLLFCLFSLAEMGTGYFPFGNVMCYIVYPVQTAFYGVGVYNMVALNVHRYYIITYSGSDRCVDKLTIVIVVLCWLVPSLITALPYAIHLRFTDGYCEEIWPTKSAHMYTVYLFIIQYVLPLLVIATLNTLTIKRLRRGETFRANCARMSSSSLHAHRRIVKMLIFIVLIFALFGLPGQVIWLLPAFTVNTMNSQYFQLLDAFPFMYCVLNPVLFFAYNKECHEMLRKFFVTFFICCDHKWRGKHRLTSQSQNGTFPTDPNFTLLFHSRASESQDTNSDRPKSDLFTPAIPMYLLDQQSEADHKACNGLVANTLLLSSLKNFYSSDLDSPNSTDQIVSPLINGTNVDQQLFRGSFVELLKTRHINNDLMRRLEASPETAIIEEGDYDNTNNTAVDSIPTERNNTDYTV